jgi:tetratricopeptide (TPR) repeat protein
LLVGACYLSTIYGFLRYVSAPDSRIWSVLTIGTCALGMGCKEVMVSAPILVLLYDRAFLTGSFRKAWEHRQGLYLGLAATWLILILMLFGIGGTRGPAAGFGLGVSTYAYALKQAEAIVRYLALSVWPHPLVLDYGTEVIANFWQVAPQLGILLALIVATFAALRWRPRLGFLLFWFFAILAPSSSFVPLVTQTVAEHRMYLPLAPIVILMCVGLQQLIGSRGFHAAAMAAMALLTCSIARNHTLQDELLIWTDNVAKAPANARGHACLGLALADRGRAADAIPHFRRALALDPKSVATEQNLGNAYYAVQEYTKAIEHFRRAITLDPRFASGYSNLGVVLLELGDTSGALEAYREALRIEPTHISAHQNIGRAMMVLGRFAEAVPHYKEVLNLRPETAASHYDLGLALSRAGKMDEAMPHFAAALRLKPAPASYYNYARLLIDMGRIRDAITPLETALQLQPDFPEAQTELTRLRILRLTPAR